MNNQEYARIIAKNLRRIFYHNGKTQAEVSRALGISKATLSSWMNGTRIPRMDKIELLITIRKRREHYGKNRFF